MTAYHEFTRAGIELGFGHLDDAAATWDAGLELAAGADMGWTSLADGGRTMIDVLRGDLVGDVDDLNVRRELRDHAFADSDEHVVEPVVRGEGQPVVAA